MKKRIFSLVTALVVLVGAFSSQSVVFAEEQIIKVYVTISNKGILASADDNSVMLNREVAVTDIDNSGTFTVEEALVAAHRTYNNEDGYAISNGFVNKLWGIESSNLLFAINNMGISSGVTIDTIIDGDKLVASINKDDATYSDWYSFFDESEKTVFTNEEFTLNLKGHLGMAFTEEDKIDVGLENIDIGIWNGGVFNEITGATTDSDGNVMLSFDAPGTYYITADGTLPSVVTDYYLMNMSTDSIPAYGKMDFTTYETQMAYTDADYGAGPYPIDEVKYVDFEIWQDAQDSYNTLRSNQLISASPIIAPGCKVTVKEKHVELMHNIAKSYVESDLTLDAGNLPWIIADLVEYEDIYPASENNLTLEEKQIYLDKIIENAEEENAVNVLAKTIIALRALGYDAKNVYNSSHEKVDFVSRLTLFIDSQDTDVTNIYRLPYVIIALSQGENYATDAQMNFLVNAAVTSADLWYDTTMGTDAMTPMILALRPFYNTNNHVKTVVDGAIDIIKSKQLTNGLLDVPDTFESASTALAIAGLSAYGIDAEETVNGGYNLIQGLVSVANDNLDGFQNSDGTPNAFGKEQSLRGLLAHSLLKEERNKAIYDFSDKPMNTAYATWGENCPVVFNVTPEDATVTINGVMPVSENKFDLSAGQYTYTVSNAGYNTLSGTIFVTDDEANSHILKTVDVSLSVYQSGGGFSPSYSNDDDESEEADEPKEEVQPEENAFTPDTFPDVKEDDWYYDSVKYAYENNLFSGTENGFEPNASMTRAMLVTVLFRLDSPENVQGNNPFNDVSDDAWYSEGVKWAAKNNIVIGVGETEFAPDSPVTREQLALIIYRYATFKGDNVKEYEETDILSYEDFSEISEYATKAMKYVNGAGILKGRTQALLSPRGGASRAEVATMLMRFIEMKR